MGVLEALRKRLRITKRRLIIGMVLGVIIGVIVPPLGLMMLILVILGLAVVGMAIVIFGSENVTHLIMTFLAVRAAVSDSVVFSHIGGICLTCHSHYNI